MNLVIVQTGQPVGQYARAAANLRFRPQRIAGIERAAAATASRRRSENVPMPVPFRLISRGDFKAVVLV